HREDAFQPRFRQTRRPPTHPGSATGQGSSPDSLILSGDSSPQTGKSSFRMTRHPRPGWSNRPGSTTKELAMKKVVLTFGLIGGVILSVMMTVALAFHEQIGFDRGVYVGYTSMVLAFLMVYFGVQSYRDNVAGGSVTFGRAFMVGLMISLVIMACYVAIWEVVY